MPQKVPKGWVKTTLGAVCLPVATIQPEESPNTDFTYFDIGGIDNERNVIAETKIITGRNAPSRARQAVRKDDILFSTVRTYLRKIARIEREYPNPVASTGFAVIRPAKGVSPQFLFYQVLSEDFVQALNELQSGSSYPAVHARDVFAQSILLPPTREQESIAAKLSGAFSALQRAETASRRALERLKRYRAAVLDAAVTGELTRNWREGRRNDKVENTESSAALLERLKTTRRQRWEQREFQRLCAAGKTPKNDRWKSRYPKPILPDVRDFPLLPSDWTWGSLEMIAEIGSGIAVSQNRVLKDAMEVPYLRVANVLRGQFDLREIKTIRVERGRLPQYLLKEGDILFNEGGDRDKLGRGWVWEGQIENCVHQNHVFRVRLFDLALLNPRFISHWGNTFGQRFFLLHATQTTNLASINRGVLSKLPVPIPPAPEQLEIMRDVDHRLAAASRLEARLEEQLVRASKTRQSLFREAFEGRLIPQNSGDERAAILLDRIRAARDIEPYKSKEKRVKPMPKPRSRRERGSLLDVLRAHNKPITPEQLFYEAGFDPSQVDLFYRELNSLRSKLQERKPTGSQAKMWPHRANVLLQLKSRAPK
jgi:type I restriction enzyme, S subunit